MIISTTMFFLCRRLIFQLWQYKSFFSCWKFFSFFFCPLASIFNFLCIYIWSWGTPKPSLTHNKDLNHVPSILTFYRMHLLSFKEKKNHKFILQMNSALWIQWLQTQSQSKIVSACSWHQIRKTSYYTRTWGKNYLLT